MAQTWSEMQRVEKARLEDGAQEMQGWKMREKQTRAMCVVRRLFGLTLVIGYI